MAISDANMLLEDRIDPWAQRASGSGCMCAGQPEKDYLADVHADGGIITIDSRTASSVWKPDVDGNGQPPINSERTENTDAVLHIESAVVDEDTNSPPYVDSSEFPWTPRCMESMPRALAVEKRGGCGDEFHEYTGNIVRAPLHVSPRRAHSIG